MKHRHTYKRIKSVTINVIGKKIGDPSLNSDDEVVFVSLCANALEKSMNQFV